MVVKTRAFPPVSGSAVQTLSSGSQTIRYSSVYKTGQESVDGAVHNPGGNNQLYLQRIKYSGSIMSGKYGTGPVSQWNYQEWPSRFYEMSASNITPPNPDLSTNGLTNALFAASNPYRANILVPAFLAELRELPKLLYDLGRLKLNKRPIFNSPSDLAKAWVGANFGWAPLLGDLQKLADFHLQTAKRQKEFDQLYSSAGLVKRVNLGTKSGASGSFDAYWGGAFSFGPLTGSAPCISKVWGVVRYRPALAPDDSPMRRPSPPELRRILSGLTRDGVTASAWELIPWSWLIDYVYDVSGALKANSGMRFLNVDRACICIHAECSMTHPADSKTDAYGRTLKVSPGTLKYEWKTRVPVYQPSIFPQPHVPELSGSQLSILGSLAFLRSRGLK